jgi:hypothetical protein
VEVLGQATLSAIHFEPIDAGENEISPQAMTSSEGAKSILLRRAIQSTQTT